MFSFVVISVKNMYLEKIFSDRLNEKKKNLGKSSE